MAKRRPKCFGCGIRWDEEGVDPIESSDPFVPDVQYSKKLKHWYCFRCWEQVTNMLARLEG